MKRNLFTWGTIAVLFLSVIVACNKKNPVSGTQPSARITPAPTAAPLIPGKLVHLVDFDYALTLDLQKLGYAKWNQVNDVFAGKMFVTQVDGKYFLEMTKLPVVKEQLPLLSSRVYRFDLSFDKEKKDYLKAFSAEIMKDGVVLGELGRYDRSSSIKNLCSKPSNYCAIQYASGDKFLSLNIFPHGPIETAFAHICKFDPNLGFGRGSRKEPSLCDDVVATSKALENHATLLDLIYPITVDDSYPRPEHRQWVEGWRPEIEKNRQSILSIKKDIGTWMNSNKAFSLADIQKRKAALLIVRFDTNHNEGTGFSAKVLAAEILSRVANKSMAPSDATKALEKFILTNKMKPQVIVPTPAPKQSRSGLGSRPVGNESL